MPPVRPKPQQQPNKPKAAPSSGNSKTVIILLAALVICAVGGYFLYPIIKDALEKSRPQQVITAPTVPEVVPVDTVQTKIAEPEPIPHKIESVSSVPKGFYIIVGSYQKKYNADNLVKSLKKDVELNVLHFQELGLYRVSAGRYDNIHKAYNDMISIKDLDGCTNAWVLENK